MQYNSIYINFRGMQNITTYTAGIHTYTMKLSRKTKKC